MPRAWRSLQATTVAGALRRFARGTGSRSTGAVEHVPDVVDWLGPSLPAVPAAAGSTPAVAAAVRDRALAAGVPEPAAVTLETWWPTLEPTVRRQVCAPLRPGRGSRHLVWGTQVAVQTDATTCGSAVVVMVNAAGDPSLALWLATGRLLPGHVPPEVRALRRIRPGALPASAQGRFAALQLVTKAVTSERALGPLRWPPSLGTPPWGAARALRFDGVRFRAEMVDDADREGTALQLARAAGALAAGLPVPLYTGGDLGGGLSHAVPRHVVLLTGFSSPDRFSVYEPGHGLSTAISRSEILARGGPHRALGGWSHAAWIVLPHP